MSETENLNPIQLNSVVDSLDNVPEDFRALYVENNGKYVINAAAASNNEAERKYQEKLNEFRNKNIEVTRQKEELEAKMAAFDDLKMKPEEVIELRKQMIEFKEKELLNRNEFEEFAKSRTETMQKAHNKTVEELKAKLNAATESSTNYMNLYREGKLHSTLIDASAETPIRREAIPDMMNRASSEWRMNNETGDLFPVDANGQPRMGSAGTDPMTMAEWLLEKSEVAPHLFEQSKAAGAVQPNAPGGIKTNGQSKWVDGNDMFALGIHAEAIARGEMDVR